MKVEATLTERKIVEIDSMTLARLMAATIREAYNIPISAYITEDGFLEAAIEVKGYKTVKIEREVVREATEEDWKALEVINKIYNFLAIDCKTPKTFKVS